MCDRIADSNNEVSPVLTYDYATIRVVPRVERGEFVNVGVIVYCAEQEFLGARVELDENRVLALAADADIACIAEHLETIVGLCSGGSTHGGIGALPHSARFHWLVAPRSTVVQTSPTHCGLCRDPQRALDDLFHKMVHPPEMN